MTNTQVKLLARPVGNPQQSDFSIEETPMPTPNDGEVLIKTQYISLDPAMRGWMNDARSYIAPVGLGDVMRAGGIGTVILSKHPKFLAGDTVSGMLNVQEYVISDGKGMVKVDPKLAPLTTYLNVLGMPGMTAYFGLLESGQPKAGETLVVSGASGAVGATVGQVGKILGLRVVGIAGGKEKCDYAINEFGFDACIDYKNQDVRKALKETCPRGIDIYFDNVGGEILDIVLTRINQKARIVICGAISQYNATSAVAGLPRMAQSAAPVGRVELAGARRHAQPAALSARAAAPGDAPLCTCRPAGRPAVVARLRAGPATAPAAAAHGAAQLHRTAQQRHRPQRRHTSHGVDASDPAAGSAAGQRRRLRPLQAHRTALRHR